MNKKKDNIFNFDQDEELRIYKYALNECIRKRRKARGLKDKYDTFKDWKYDYVMKKYEHITLSSLIDFHKYLKRKLENQMDKDTAVSGFIYPILIMIIGVYVTYATDVIPNKLIGIIVSAAFILYAARSIIKDRINDDIVIKNLYRDYIEAIDELMRFKENQILSDEVKEQ